MSIKASIVAGSPSPLLSVEAVQDLEDLLLKRPAQHKSLLVFALEVAIDRYLGILERPPKLLHAPTFEACDALVPFAQVHATSLRTDWRNSPLGAGRILAQPLIIFLDARLLIIKLNEHRLGFSEALQ